MSKDIKTSDKSRLVALLLCVLIGVLGVHRMYVGKYGTGVTQLLLTITGVGMIITGIWVLIDLILIAAGAFQDARKAYVTNWQS